MTDEPYIFTSKGNVPLSTLNYTHCWEDGLLLRVKPVMEDGTMQLDIEKEGQMIFVEEYHDKETGELVKRSVAVYQFQGLNVASDSGQFG